MTESKLDPRLRALQQQPAAERAEFADSMRLSAARSGTRFVQADVLLRVRKGRGTKTTRTVERKLTDLGVNVRTIVDGPDMVVSGTVAIDQLDSLLAEDWIELVESSQRMYADLDVSGADVGIRPLHTVTPTVRGTNVLVGIVDGGIDFSHDDFRLSDGSSRVRFLWDQSSSSVAGGRVPYGREYTKADIDAALRTNPAPVPITHRDRGGHGTHVAGVAAGSGRTSSGQFMGMAADAELVVVATRGDGGTLGESASTMDACKFIVDRAKELARPVAINMSLGMNGGGHSGEMPLETAMDSLSRLPGVVLVKSAGNEQMWRIHAQGRVAANQTVRRQFDSVGDNLQDDVLEVWFDSADAISIAVQAPGGPTPTTNDFVLPGNANNFVTAAGNSVRIDAQSTDAGGTGDVRAMIFVRRATSPRIQPGRWTIHFQGGNQIADGTFHAWIERTTRNPQDEQSRFTAADYDPTCTIRVPGTARRVITVGSYVTRFDGDAALGEISRFSSRGPTRYGLRKPEIAAPGESVVSARSTASLQPAHIAGYTLMPGTSMAAPHVTGVAALLLEVNPDLTCDQVKQILSNAARRDGAAAGAPDDTWGTGRLAAQRAVELARTVHFPIVTDTTVNGSQLTWTTDIPTTGAVRFNPNIQRMLLGRAFGSRASLSVGTQHTIDLAGLPSSTYHCEILAFTPAPDEWYTIADSDGQLFTAVVN